MYVFNGEFSFEVEKLIKFARMKQKIAVFGHAATLPKQLILS